MSLTVEKSNSFTQHPPETLDELIKFVEFVKLNSNEMFVQISGMSVELIKSVAEYFNVNFFDTSDMKVDMNPFMIIYITHEGEILPRAMTYKTKIVIYARRPVYNHH